MRGRSKFTQLLFYLEEFFNNLNCSEISYSLYFDFSKAFDKLRHSILVYELSLFGIGGNLLRLMDSYLSDRYQCVKVKGSYSTWQLITSGLPQGSVFGPLLFIAFHVISRYAFPPQCSCLLMTAKLLIMILAFYNLTLRPVFSVQKRIQWSLMHQKLNFL